MITLLIDPQRSVNFDFYLFLCSRIDRLTFREDKNKENAIDDKYGTEVNLILFSNGSNSQLVLRYTFLTADC